MIEMRHIDASTARLGHAGDTYNTAVYLRRAADELGADVVVCYLAGLGTDEYSIDMRAAWVANGVLDRSLTVEGYLPGLYSVRVDDRGERRFSYWRSASAARALFGGTDWLEHLDADVVHLSGITLQLASGKARAGLLERLRDLRARGAWVSLDTNYRPSGWTSSGEAARVMDQVSQVASIVLATLEDEVAMHGCRSVVDCADRLAALGVPEIVVKCGADGAYLLAGGPLEHSPAAPVKRVVDTTAAGDAFAGGISPPGSPANHHLRRRGLRRASPRRWWPTRARSSPQPSRSSAAPRRQAHATRSRYGVDADFTARDDCANRYAWQA